MTPIAINAMTMAAAYGRGRTDGIPNCEDARLYVAASR